MTLDPLDYESPVPAAEVRPWGPAIWLVAWLVFDAVVVTIALGVVTPRLQGFFSEFKADVPVATKLWLAFSQWFGANHGFMIVWALTAAAASAVLALRPPARGPQRSGLWVLAILLARYGWIPLAIFAAIALVTPYVNLLEQLSSPHAK